MVFSDLKNDIGKNRKTLEVNFVDSGRLKSRIKLRFGISGQKRRCAKWLWIDFYENHPCLEIIEPPMPEQGVRKNQKLIWLCIILSFEKMVFRKSPERFRSFRRKKVSPHQKLSFLKFIFATRGGIMKIEKIFFEKSSKFRM